MNPFENLKTFQVIWKPVKSHSIPQEWIEEAGREYIFYEIGIVRMTQLGYALEIKVRVYIGKQGDIVPSRIFTIHPSCEVTEGELIELSNVEIIEYAPYDCFDKPISNYGNILRAVIKK